MKKLISIFIIMIMILFLGTLCVHAASSYDCDLVLTPDKEKYEPGDTVEITVSAKNINAGEGITGISAVISCAPEAFEEINDKSFVKMDKWSEPELFGTTVYTNVSTCEGQTTDQDMFKIRSSLQSDVENGTYNVALSSIDFGTDDYTTIHKDKYVLPITVEKTTQNPNEPDPEEETKPTLSINKGDNAYNIVAHDDVGLDRIEITVVETQEVIKVKTEGKDFTYNYPLKENDDNLIKVVAINTQNVKSKEISVKWSKKKDENQGEQNQGEQNQGEQNQGEQNQGEQNQGKQNQGEQNQGEQNKGEQKQDEQKQDEQKASSQKDSTTAGNLKPTTKTQKDDTVLKKEIDNAGLTIEISVLIVAAIAIGIVAYIKYRKYNKIK